MFEYLLKKVRSATVRVFPFPHLRIDDFFDSRHFRELQTSPEINLGPMGSNSDLRRRAGQVGYVPIKFPGAFHDWGEYQMDQSRRAQGEGEDLGKNLASESRGLVLRLAGPSSRCMQDLNFFMESGELQREVCIKLGVEMGNGLVDGGIQKYLDGYEIPPHPDVRQKLLTLLLPLHPSTFGMSVDQVSLGTQLLKFRQKYEVVSEFWEQHELFDRCWCPWSWCETVEVHHQANSLLAFSPSNKSLHGVKARYDHLSWQRTHLYSNVWHKESPCERQPQHDEILSLVAKSLPERRD